MKGKIKNIIYKVEIGQLKADRDASYYTQFKYGDGYLILFWKNQGDKLFNWYGFVTPDELKVKLGVEQWRKFRNGKLEFNLDKTR